MDVNGRECGVVGEQSGVDLADDVALEAADDLFPLPPAEESDAESDQEGGETSA